VCIKRERKEIERKRQRERERGREGQREQGIYLELALNKNIARIQTQGICFELCVPPHRTAIEKVPGDGTMFWTLKQLLKG
jgi:hypothetical protein